MQPQTVRQLQGEAIRARDGAIGEVMDVYFDDERWAVRYLVVDTGTWLPGRQVLISPASLDPAQSDDEIAADLTREQVKSAPGVDTDQPVSRQHEIAIASHFGTPWYWGGPALWGTAAYPIPPTRAEASSRPAQAQAPEGDSHLRSGAEVIGYNVEAADGALGAVDDFVIDPKSWAIRDVVIDTRKWWPGGQVRIAPEQVESIDWAAGRMRVRMTREALKAAARR
jgi:uncharacterized protein YrrD